MSFEVFENCNAIRGSLQKFADFSKQGLMQLLISLKKDLHNHMYDSYLVVSKSPSWWLLNNTTVKHFKKCKAVYITQTEQSVLMHIGALYIDQDIAASNNQYSVWINENQRQLKIKLELSKEY